VALTSLGGFIYLRRRNALVVRIVEHEVDLRIRGVEDPA